MQTGLEIGAIIAGRYEIERFIGAGSLAEVFLVHDGEHRYALKVFLPKVMPVYVSAAKIENVLREKGVRRPGIVSPLSVGEDHGLKFVVLPYVEGCSVRAWLDHLQDIEQTAHATAAALVLDRVLAILGELPPFVVHGALKPSNILLGGVGPEDGPAADTRIYLTDYGTCHLLSFSKYASLQLSAGSPYYYLAPEFISFGGKVDPRADQYSLGVLTYEMLTGRLPRKGFKPIRELDLNAPEEWDDLLSRLLAKRPEDRFASFAELQQTLHDFTKVIPASPAYEAVEIDFAAESAPPAPVKAAAFDALLEASISSSEHLQGEEPAPAEFAAKPAAPALVPELELEAVAPEMETAPEVAAVEAEPVEPLVEVEPPPPPAAVETVTPEAAKEVVELPAEAITAVETPLAEVEFVEAEAVPEEPPPPIAEEIPEAQPVEAEEAPAAEPVVEEAAVAEVAPPPSGPITEEFVVERPPAPEPEMAEAAIEEKAPPVEKAVEAPLAEEAPLTPPPDEVGDVIEKIIAAEKEKERPPVVEPPAPKPVAPAVKPRPAPKPRLAKAPARRALPGWAVAAVLVVAVAVLAFVAWRQQWVNFSSLSGGARPTPVAMSTPLPPPPVVTPEPVSPTPPITNEEEKKKKIAELIDQAKAYMKDKAYMRPRRACALFTLQQLADLDSGNSFIADAKRTMLDELRLAEQQAVSREHWDDAYEAARDALVIAPDNVEFRKLFDDAQKNRSLAALLDKLRGYMQQERYVAPPDACAFYVVRQIETLQPNHPDAQQARQTMTQRLLAQAQQAYSQKKYDQAMSLAQGGLEVSPGDPRFLSLLTKAKEAKATTPPPTPAPTPSPTPAPTPVVAQHCPDGMRFITAGSLRMGSAPDDPERKPGEKPNTPVFVAAFCIDLYEYPNQPGAQPRVNVNYYAAQKLCSESGKRLCSEREWERTCKGPGNRRYPYGDTYNPNACATQDAGGAPRGVAPSGGWSGCRSSFGVYDLSGNVREWTASPISPGQSAYVVRGGSANLPDWAVRCATREAAMPNTQSYTLGFRCCRDAE